MARNTNTDRKHTHTGTCQICERRQAINPVNGNIAKHGYTVDWGYFNGTCPGSDHQPYEASCALIPSIIAGIDGELQQRVNSRKCLVAFPADRKGWEWLPIFELSTAEVFQTIKDAGQQPHPAYAAGNKRLSCLFCIFGSQGDIQNGAKQNPNVYQRFLALEAKTGYSMHQSRRPLREIVEGKIKVVADDDFDFDCTAGEAA